MIDDADEKWTRARDGKVIHRDGDAHARLVARTLGLNPLDWAAILDRYADLWRPDRDDSPGRLATLGEAMKERMASSSSAQTDACGACPMCGGTSCAIAITRHNRDQPTESTWARCASCGHGFLVSGAAEPGVYGHDDYYLARDAGGAGYDDYLAERDYRERKGARLLDAVARLSPRAPKRLLEVGSGFGYTRRAAEERGIATVGVDVNPSAGQAAARLYGLQTFAGTLRQWSASAEGASSRGCFDLVLYQFVLEHLSDPREEVEIAMTALSPGGLLVVMVPSMDALELSVFGAAYRSLRRDHLHLFSRRSLEHLFAAVGGEVVGIESGCSLHLLAGFVSRSVLDSLYSSGRGPDWLGIAQRSST